MKILFKTSLIVIALLLGITANAQEKPLTFGVKAGMNLANFSGDGDFDSKIGFNVGVTVDYALPSNLYILSGLEFTIKGGKTKAEYIMMEEDVAVRYKVTANPMYLQLPVHLGYKLAVTEGVNLVFHTGPYIAYGVGGKRKSTKTEYTKDEKNSIGGKEDFFGDDKAKRFDFGLGLGAGAEFGKIGVGLGYDFGLVKLYDESNNKNMNAYLSVGYKF